MSRSAFRFVPSNRSGQYSVWRVDQPIGHVTKIVHRINDRGIPRTVVAGWTPGTPDRIDLAIATTRETAAKALWTYHQTSR
jgi:uncharacterized protein YbdZ (MbtH family)